MARVSDRGSGPERRRHHSSFGYFGLGRAGRAGVIAVDFDAVWTLRRQRHSHGDQFLIFHRNGPVGDGDFIEGPKRLHYFGRKGVHFLKFTEVFFFVHRF